MNLTIFVISYYRYYSGAGHDKDMSTWGLIIFLIPWVLVLIASMYYLLVWHEMKIQYFFKYFRSLGNEYKDILKKQCRFYQSLSPDKKSAFEKRVHYFLINKKFVPIEMEEVTDEMRVMIAACCVQLTFGLGPVFLSRFSKIRVFSTSIDWKMKFGQKREIWIPWYEFQDGYNISDDGFNIGLEIMTMALALEDRLGSKSGRIFGTTTYRVWKEKSRIYAEAFIRKGVTKYHSYKEVNKDEYFAVSVVYFFEKPEDFYNRFPELYNILVKLLKQNPLKLKRPGKG